MDIAWEMIKLDIFATISQSCQRLFADSNINSRYKRFERAEAIQIMSLEFLNLAKYERERVNLEREENSRDDILSRIEVAMEISLLQVRPEYTSSYPCSFFKISIAYTKNWKTGVKF